jgi:putative DNA primase/helicase
MTPWLPVRPETIPPELRALGWVLWRAEPRPGDKPAKVPYQIADPMLRASSTNPATWGAFGDAVEAYGGLADLPAHPIRGTVAGIGVVLTREARVTCLDLDRVIDAEGQLDVRAATIVERCDSWAEVSPSGTGLHVFVRGTVPKALKGRQIEVYASERYIAVTGHQWPGTPDTLRGQQPYLDHLTRLDAEDRAPRRAYTGAATPPPDDLAGALLARLQTWGVPVTRLKRWSDGFLVELLECPWSGDHTTGPGGAAVIIHASGAYDFTCLHAHCEGRDWRAFRAAMEQRR